MKYTLEERLDIGRKIYEGGLTKHEAFEWYGISETCARDYMRLYRDTNQLPPKNAAICNRSIKVPKGSEPCDLESLEAMTKEELIGEIVKARITEARLKKGYEVKGDGVVILYDSKNIK